MKIVDVLLGEGAWLHPTANKQNICQLVKYDKGNEISQGRIYIIKYIYIYMTYQNIIEFVFLEAEVDL